VRSVAAPAYGDPDVHEHLDETSEGFLPMGTSYVAGAER
jgi:hypothetical protein